MKEKIVNLSVSQLKPGMKLGKTIKSHFSGEIIVKKGIVLTQKIIDDIQKYFDDNRELILKAVGEKESIFRIKGREVIFPSKVSKHVKSAISKETLAATLNIVDDIIRDVRIGKSINSEKAEKCVGDILEEIINNEDAALNLINIKNFDDYLHAHSINVSTISLLIGFNMNLPRKDIIQLGLGALLHDLGKMKVPIEILNKEGKLNNEEFEIMKKHPELSLCILKGEKNISDIVEKIAKQHHEKFDGTGYPDGLKGEEIDIFARIVAIADVYDALTTDRSYRQAMLPYEAMKLIVSGSGKHFDPNIVRILLKAISIYPAGSYIKLNTGEIAVVLKVNKDRIIRPMVRIIKNNVEEEIEPFDVDLYQDTKRIIVGAIGLNE